MECCFCKKSIKEEDATKISSKQDSTRHSCSECMSDIWELMESGAMEEKDFLMPKNAGVLTYHDNRLAEKFNNKYRYFDNKIIRLGKTNEKAYQNYQNFGFGSPSVYGIEYDSTLTIELCLGRRSQDIDARYSDEKYLYLKNYSAKFIP